MKRATLALVLALVAVQASAELQAVKLVTSSAGADTRTINAGTLVVINDGASTIHVRVFWQGETPADATQSSPEIKSGESFTFNRTSSIVAISIISESSSTVRLTYW
jgi:hypothetical protein